MSIEQAFKNIQEAFEKLFNAAKVTIEELSKAFVKVLVEYEPIQYIPPKHRQMRYCWNKSRNWKRARGWQE